MTTIGKQPVNGRPGLEDPRVRVNGHRQPWAIDWMLDGSSALVHLRLSIRFDGIGLPGRAFVRGGFEFTGPRPERPSIRTAIRALVADASRSDERARTFCFRSDPAGEGRISVDSGVRVGSGDLEGRSSCASRAALSSGKLVRSFELSLGPVVRARDLDPRIDPSVVVGRGHSGGQVRVPIEILYPTGPRRRVSTREGISSSVGRTPSEAQC
jgi:hypothetical protein